MRDPINNEQLWFCVDHRRWLEESVKQVRERENARARSRRSAQREQGALFSNASADRGDISVMVPWNDPAGGPESSRP
jgi:hypothetical protein